jgi:hypothetical protein
MNALTFEGGSRIERRGACRVCGRALKNPKYVELGVGPVCAGKVAAARPNYVQRVPPLVSDFEVVQVTDEAVWIIDLDRGGASVTNDADRVVEDLAAKYGARRIIYRDSIGNWDELRHEAGRFLGFAPARDMEPAGFRWAREQGVAS